jgi:hypothetical protein
MLRRVACVGLLVTLAACRDRIPLYDGLLDAAASGGADSGWQRDEWAPWQDPNCTQISQPANFFSQWQEIIIVLDRSASMQAAFPGASSKQAAVQTALNDAIGAVQSRVRFGLELFPGDTNGGSGSCSHNTCCAGDPSVAPTINAQSAIGSYLSCSEQSECTSDSFDSPAHKALEQVQKFLSYWSRWSDPRLQSSYVLLITASEPSCASEAGNGDSCPAKTAAAQLNNYDVPIVILTVGFDPRNNPNSCLVQIGKNGSPGSDRLNTPSSYSALKDTLSSLFKAAARKSCTFTTYDIIPDFAEVSVSMGSGPIPKDGPEGWSFDGTDRTRIKLGDKACDQFISSSARTITVSYPCFTCDGPKACQHN